MRTEAEIREAQEKYRELEEKLPSSDLPAQVREWLLLTQALKLEWLLEQIGEKEQV